MLSSSPVQRQPILFLDHALALGGAELSLLLLIKYLDPQRWSSHLGCRSGILAQRAITQDIPTHLLDLPRLRRSTRFPIDWFVGAREIARLAQQIKARLLIANTMRTAVYCALASRFISIPFIWYMRDFWLNESQPRFPFFDSLGKKVLCRAGSKVITNSAASASYLPCTSKVFVVHSGLEVAKYNPSLDSASFRQEYTIPIETQIVGMAGRLRPWKGQERFLHMASEVLAKLPKAHFILVGGDPFHIDEGYINDLKSLTRALGIRNNVTFTGHLADIRPALAAMDVFVHPGDPEPFGLVNIEAMASGKPVVAFAQGALPEIVVPNITGILVPPGDVIALAQAVIDLLQDQERTAEMGQRGRQIAFTQFTIHQTVHKVEHLFEQLLQ